MHTHMPSYKCCPNIEVKINPWDRKIIKKYFTLLFFFFLCLSSKSIVSSMYLQSCLVRSLSTQWHFFKDIIKRSLVESDDACTEVIGWNISTWAVTETTIIKRSNALHVCQQHSCKDERFRYHIHPFCH